MKNQPTDVASSFADMPSPFVATTHPVVIARRLTATGTAGNISRNRIAGSWPTPKPLRGVPDTVREEKPFVPFWQRVMRVTDDLIVGVDSLPWLDELARYNCEDYAYRHQMAYWLTMQRESDAAVGPDHVTG